MRASRLVKLVRDKVGRSTDTVHYRELTLAEHQKALRSKLLEEVGEYLQAPSVDELADIYEVVRTLAPVDLGVLFATVEMVAEVKRRRRGALGSGQGMFIVGDQR